MSDGVMRQVRADEPMMIAWQAYRQTDDYANVRHCADDRTYVDGSLWACFVAGWQAQEAAITSARAEEEIAREALRLIKLACLGTSTGWPAKRIIYCITRLCIDAGIREPHTELGTERRYKALTVRGQNRIEFALLAEEPSQ